MHLALLSYYIYLTVTVLGLIIAEKSHTIKCLSIRFLISVSNDLLHIVLSAVPGPKIKASLKNAVVTEGDDAVFSLELSTSMIGTWFLNSMQLQDSERFSITQSKNQHILRIHQVPNVYDGAEITFIATGVRDSAVLQIKGQYLLG